MADIAVREAAELMAELGAGMAPEAGIQRRADLIGTAHGASESPGDVRRERHGRPDPGCSPQRTARERLDAIAGQRSAQGRSQPAGALGHPIGRGIGGTQEGDRRDFPERRPFQAPRVRARRLPY